MDLGMIKISSAIHIDHPNVLATIGCHFLEDEEALEAVNVGRYEIVSHCDKSDVGDIYDNISKGNYRAYSLQHESFDVLVVINFDYYLIVLQK
jgi:hypothetical protein